jgi:hypothetical protein
MKQLQIMAIAALLALPNIASADMFGDLVKSVTKIVAETTSSSRQK